MIDVKFVLLEAVLVSLVWKSISDHYLRFLLFSVFLRTAKVNSLGVVYTSLKRCCHHGDIGQSVFSY